MGWWNTNTGSVIGDAAADYVSTLCAQGIVCAEASELPRAVRDHLDALYIEALGRPAMDAELTELLGFAGG